MNCKYLIFGLLPQNEPQDPQVLLHRDNKLYFSEGHFIGFHSLTIAVAFAFKSMFRFLALQNAFWN